MGVVWNYNTARIEGRRTPHPMIYGTINGPGCSVELYSIGRRDLTTKAGSRGETKACTSQDHGGHRRLDHAWGRSGCCRVRVTSFMSYVHWKPLSFANKEHTKNLTSLLVRTVLHSKSGDFRCPYLTGWSMNLAFNGTHIWNRARVHLVIRIHLHNASGMRQPSTHTISKF